MQIEEAPRPPYVRRPGDALHLAVAVTVLVAGTGIALLLQDQVLAFERDVISTSTQGSTRHHPHAVDKGLRAFTALAGVALFGAMIVRRRFRIALYLVLAYVVAIAVAAWATGLLEHLEPPAFADAQRRLELRDQWNLSGVGYLASVTAVITVAVSYAGHRWRQLAGLALVLAIVARLVTSSLLPATALFEIAVGWAVGLLILLVLKAPNPQPTARDIAAALTSAGLPLASLKFASVDARGSVPYFAVTTTGQRAFVKVLGAGQRSADVLFRLYRKLRFRDVGDKTPFMSVRREVEHEALLTLSARDAGVHTPRPLAVTEVEARSPAMLLALEQLDGHSLDSVDAEALDDRVLDQLWEQVRLLRARRIAHRDLRLANVFLDDSGQPWIIDFGFSELAVEDYVLADDVVGLLASTALKVGAERAVAAVAKALGPEPLAHALPRMEPDALSSATRKGLAKNKPLLADLRAATQKAADVDEVQFERLQRIRPAMILSVLMLGGAVWFLYPQLADAGTIVDRIRHVEPAWAVLAALASVLTYVGATLGMLGAVPRQLRPLRTFVAQLASSFVNRITPAQVGGYALNVRFLQKAGVETPVAVTSVGLNSLAGLIVHMFLLVLFLLWTGSSGLGGVKLPSTKVFAYITIAAVVSLVVFFALPVGRQLVRRHVWPVLRQGAAGLVTTARQPTKLLLLFGGSVVVTMSYILGLSAAVQAFGGGVPFAHVGLAYLTASVVATAAPTPGGLGAAEAAFAIALGLAGLNQATAISAVFLYRFCTFWLPILPGWLSYRFLHQHGAL